MSIIRRLLKEKRPLFVDGATGTMLQALGMPAGVNPAKFCLERPDVVRGVHRAYAEAGADILWRFVLQIAAGYRPRCFQRGHGSTCARRSG